MSITQFSTSTEQIGALVVEEAMNRFEYCGFHQDFCIKHVGEAAVFGETNRVIFSVIKGWYPVRAYCTAKFLENWDKLYGKTSSTPPSSSYESFIKSCRDNYDCDSGVNGAHPKVGCRKCEAAELLKETP